MREFGSVLIGGAIGGLELLDAAAQAIDPIGTYLFGDELGVNSDITPQIPTSNFGGSSAGGGFVLYPNKPNTNMMQQVYSK